MNNKQKSIIFRRAWHLFKTNQKPTFRDALIYSWHIQKTKRIDFNEIAKTYKEVYNELSGWINHKLSYTPERQTLTSDFIQDTFLVVLEKIHMFDPNKASMKTWIHLLCKNIVIDESRRAYNSKIVSYDNLEFDAPPDKEPNNPDSGVYNSIISVIKNMNNETYQNIAMLRFVEGREFKEIAKMLNLPLGTVKVSVMRCKKILQPQLEMYR